MGAFRFKAAEAFFSGVADALRFTAAEANCFAVGCFRFKAAAAFFSGVEDFFRVKAAAAFFSGVADIFRFKAWTDFAETSSCLIFAEKTGTLTSSLTIKGATNNSVTFPSKACNQNCEIKFLRLQQNVSTSEEDSDPTEQLK